MSVSGFVSLIGAGPGDPELITVRGQRALAAAEVIIYDDLVDRRILTPYAGRTLHGLGDRRAPSRERQQRLHALLAAEAGAGRRVAHLKGGDPLLFARGLEELEFLRARAIPYEVIPGITAAVAAAAYAELPLTRRQRASSVAFCTGHTTDGHTAEIAVPQADTLVYYMAAARLAEIAQRVLAAGWPAATPLTLVRYATRPDQAVLTATLGQAAAGSVRLAPPLVALIGPGAAPLVPGGRAAGTTGESPAADEAASALGGRLVAGQGRAPVPADEAPAAVSATSESGGPSIGPQAAPAVPRRAAAGPLNAGNTGSTGRPPAAPGSEPVEPDNTPISGGVTPADPAGGGPGSGTERVASARTTAGSFGSWFSRARKVLVTGTNLEPYRGLGELVHTPLIRIAPPEDITPLDEALDRLASFDLVAFTSRYAVAAVFDRLLEQGGDSRRLAQATVAVVGSSTAGALRARGLLPDVTAAPESTAGLISGVRARLALDGLRVLLPRSQIGDPELPATLRRDGAAVTETTAYRTLPVADPVAVDLTALAAVLFTSPSTVHAFRRLYGPAPPPALELWCRGPLTRAAAHAAFGRGDPLPPPPAEPRPEAP